MLIQRIVTAVVLLAVLIASLYVSNTAFELVIGAGFAMTLAEWLLIAKFKRLSAYLISGVYFVAMVAFSVSGVTPAGAWFIGLELAVTCVWMAILAVVTAARETGFGVRRSSSVCMALTFVPAAWLAVVWLVREGGWPLMLSVFALVWLADICAYFSGMAFGKHRMAPAISPKKTWEGAVGAVVCVFAAAWMASIFATSETVFTNRIFAAVGPVVGFGFVLVLVAVSIAGDLFESALKRQAGVKDSGTLLPGHGGFYDRLDAALAVLHASVALLIVL